MWVEPLHFVPFAWLCGAKGWIVNVWKIGFLPPFPQPTSFCHHQLVPCMHSTKLSVLQSHVINMESARFVQNLNVNQVDPAQHLAATQTHLDVDG